MKRMWFAVPFVGGIVVALLLFVFAPAANGEPAGTAQAGKAFWGTKFCSRCHGSNAEGGFGPDLAGRGLNFQQVARAIRQPWGIMPAFTTDQVNDQNVADLVAFFSSLPAVAEPGAWRTTVAADAPLGQRLLVETAGCGQCHGDVLDRPRQALGGEGADFALFADQVYNHTKTFPRGQMGNFSKARLTEDSLKGIWTFISQDLGLRAQIGSSVSAKKNDDGTVTYTLVISNTGQTGKGLVAGDFYVALNVPADSTVVSNSTSGTSLVSTSASVGSGGFQGVQPFAAGGNSIATWLLPRLAPQERVTFSITVSGSGAADGSSAFVRWIGPTKFLAPGVPGDFFQTNRVRPQ